MAMKALLSATVLFLSLACLPGCKPPTTGVELQEEDTSVGVTFTLPAADGSMQEQTFCEVCSSEHAVAYIQAHSVSDEDARDLLNVFETAIYPALPWETERLSVLILYMDGQTYGHTPFPVTEQGPIVCLNALYPEHLAYALAHEYQHLCAFRACVAGGTSLSEETDELLSDIFCELLFPERSVLSETRTVAARERIEAWGNDALPHAYDRIRAGYSEEEWLKAMENQ